MSGKIITLNKQSKEKTRIINYKLDVFKETTFDGVYKIGYERIIVTVNDFIVATFIDEKSMIAFIELFKIQGIQFFPKNICEIINAQGNEGILLKTTKNINDTK